MTSERWIAALPMYDWPERRSDVDAEWIAIRDQLRARNIPAPDTLIRRNADMPAVPGGIRDAAGKVIAPDPATLPPDELDLFTLWRHPALIYAQTCYGPMEHGLETHVTVVADPDYSDIEGGQGQFYSSVLVMNRNKLPGDIKASNGVRAPDDGSPVINVAMLDGLHFAYNEPHSMSGYLALEKDLTAAGSGMEIFTQFIQTGAHRASLQAVAQGNADLAAIDARSWDMAKTYNPDVTSMLLPVGWTGRRPGLPFITANKLAHFFIE